MRTRIKWILVLAALVAVYAVLWPSEAISPAEKEALREGRVIITYWDRHMGHEHASRRKLIDEFNQSQDKVFVRALSVGYDASMEKILTSIAGRTPPDIIGIDGTIMAQLVAQGCFSPLDEFLAETPAIRGEDFFPACWDAVHFDGRTWGIPTTCDTYCLLWNKNAFRKAGLDPERPPQTIAELQDYAARLTIRGDSGIEQIGYLPWMPWDMSTMWGLMFGGRWVDEATGRAVCGGDPGIIRMFEWQQSFALPPDGRPDPAHALDPQKVQSFQQGFGAYMSANNPFYSGKVAMIAEGEWQVTFIPVFAPELDWGVAPLPVPDGAEPSAYQGAPVCDCIPAGCRHPEAAWEYLRWFYSPRPDGGVSPVSDYNHMIHNIPCRPAEARQDRFLNNPKFAVFVDVLLSRRVVAPPVNPVVQFMADVMERQRERVVFYRATPEEAARAIEDEVNREMDRVAALLGEATP